jgi:hypothetical protein
LAAILVASLIPAASNVLAQTTSVRSDPAAEFVPLTADIEILQWGGGLGGTDGPRSQSFEIHVVVGRDKWVIGERFSGQTNYYSFDGTKIVEWACFVGPTTPQAIDGLAVLSRPMAIPVRPS